MDTVGNYRIILFIANYYNQIKIPPVCTLSLSVVTLEVTLNIIHTSNIIH